MTKIDSFDDPPDIENTDHNTGLPIYHKNDSIVLCIKNPWALAEAIIQRKVSKQHIETWLQTTDKGKLFQVGLQLLSNNDHPTPVL